MPDLMVVVDLRDTDFFFDHFFEGSDLQNGVGDHPKWGRDLQNGVDVDRSAGTPSH